MNHTAPPASDPTAAPDADREDRRLRTLRWAVRATLTLGVAASVAANVLHARPNPISQIIAAWPPLALLLTVELISRVPHYRWHLGAIRVTAATLIAGIAAWVSYWHLAGVAARYGENGFGAAYLLPLSVDGLVIVASVSLVEISAHIRATEAPEPSTPAAAAQAAVPPAITAEEPVSDASSHPLPITAGPGTALSPASAGPVAVAHATGSPWSLSVDQGTDEDGIRPPVAHRQDPSGSAATHSTDAVNETTRPATETENHRRPHTEADLEAPVAATDTAAAVAYWRRHDPQLQPAEIAVRIGRSERTVRRHWQPRTPTHTTRVNGRPVRQRRR
ncbi:DUF2637 domain-containing protein [Micromonospora sp. HUAS LYJ1]|uniref:DUF2637 domain-containing protein n=1 Tax=Micromonospora sp. HUAS LYJ1 TaxID=3061626 RepID=UPI0026728581|nr:DUF2637 domain-containing protein [Micromonospora sp. HUAS LYJ1]WKU03406.1 DUF2637 domain-containing protein [Micromonospora sp. HUAS LYJ1]